MAVCYTTLWTIVYNTMLLSPGFNFICSKIVSGLLQLFPNVHHMRPTLPEKNCLNVDKK